MSEKKCLKEIMLTCQANKSRSSIWLRIYVGLHQTWNLAALFYDRKNEGKTNDIYTWITSIENVHMCTKHVQNFLKLKEILSCLLCTVSKIPPGWGQWRLNGSINRTTPHEDNSPPDKNKAQPLPTRTTIPRTIPHQDNSPLGPLPRNKTTHQDQNLYSGELSSWGVVQIRD